MTRLTVVTAATPDALLRAAAAPFLCEGRPTEPLPILAVRQGGLRDEVHELAARAGCVGWLGKPVVVFAELPRLFAGETDALDEFQRRAIIERILGAVSPRTLPGASRTMVESLERLFGDLVADSVEPDTFAAALQHAGRDAWELGRDDDLRRLYAAYRREVAATGQSEGRDAFAVAVRAVRENAPAARQRLRRPFDTAASPRALHIYGLADLRRGWGAFLAALRAADVVAAINVYLLDGADEFIAELKPDAVERVDSASSEVDRRIAASATAAPDLSRELDHVARRVKRLIVEEGALPHEIAVVARKARPHLTRAAATFAAHGIPVHARLRHTLTEIPAVAALLRVFRIAGDGWRVKDLEALAASPYFDIPLDRDIMRRAVQAGSPRGLAAWRTALGDLRGAIAQASPDPEDDSLPSLERVERAIAAFHTFARAAERLGAERMLAEWIALTRASIDSTGDDGLLGYSTNASPELAADAPPELRDAVRLDEAALVSTLELLDAWRRAVAALPATRMLGAAEWATELADVLDENEVTVRTGAPGGVHLLEALAASGRSFRHVFVLGLESGAFPANPSPNVFFADGELARLAESGLPMEPSSVWLAREGDLFGALEASSRESFHLSWSYADAAGSPQLASAFAEDAMARHGIVHETIAGSSVVVDGVEEIWSAAEALNFIAASGAVGADADDVVLTTATDLLPLHLAQLTHAVTIERARNAARTAEAADRAELAGAWHGDVSDEVSREYLAARFSDRTWSATQLERIGRCGFSFLGGTALGVRSAGDIDPDDADARDVGSARHAALARIYPRIQVTFGGGAPDDAKLASIRQVVHEEVEAAIDEQGGAWTRLAGLRRARVRELVDELVAYIAWEMTPAKKANFERTMLEAEVAFGMVEGGTPPVTLDAGDGRTVRLKGQIDRVDEVHAPDGQSYRYVVDHKSSNGGLKPRGELEQAGAMLQLALYLKATEALEPGAKVWGGTYQIVGKAAREGVLERCGVSSGKVKSCEGKTQQSHDATIQGAPTLAANLVDAVLAGKLPPRPPGKTDCMPYCDFRDACRGDRLKPRTW